MEKIRKRFEKINYHTLLKYFLSYFFLLSFLLLCFFIAFRNQLRTATPQAGIPAYRKSSSFFSRASIMIWITYSISITTSAIIPI